MSDGGATTVREQLRESRQAMGAVFSNPAMRKLQLAFAGSTVGDWAYGTALMVYVYEADGAAALGILSVVRYVAIATIGPFAATLADKFDRRKVMIGSDLVRAVLVLLAAVVIAGGGSSWLVYALAFVTSIASTPFRPAQGALLPNLARSPDELTAANVASSTIESLAFFVGPAIGALLIATVGVEAAYLVNAVSFLWSAALVSRIRPVAKGDDQSSAGDLAGDLAGDSDGDGPGAKTGALAEAMAGFTTIKRSRDLRLVMGLYVVQTIVAGASAVFEIVMVVEMLGMSTASVGILDAVLGVGGLLGAFLALMLAQRRRLAQDFGFGVVLWGAPLLLVVVWPELAPALIAMFFIGLGNSVVDINAITIIQRVTPDETMGRVFGALDSAIIGGMAVGALLTPAMISGIGIRPTLAVIAAVTIVSVMLGWAGLVRIDRKAQPPRHVALLRRISFFAPLPEAVVERLARELTEVYVVAGAPIVEEGAVGDRYYVIEAGQVEVAGIVLGPGEGFGEIALLRDVPRTATVRARTDVVLQAVERDDFLAAVTGHGDATAEAEAIANARLAALRSA
jgi:MFS family permease